MTDKCTPATWNDNKSSFRSNGASGPGGITVVLYGSEPFLRKTKEAATAGMAAKGDSSGKIAISTGNSTGIRQGTLGVYGNSPEADGDDALLYTTGMCAPIPDLTAGELWRANDGTLKLYADITENTWTQYMGWYDDVNGWLYVNVQPPELKPGT